MSSSIWQTGLLAYLGLGNVAQVMLTDAYFSPRAEFNPFTHMWSLGVEEQFYLLFPLLALLIAGGTAAGSGLLRRTLLICLVASGVVSLGYAAWATVEQPSAAYYLLPARWWELSAGVGLAFMHHRGRWILGPRWRAQFAVSIGLGLVALGLVFSRPDAFPWPWALLAVAGTTVCIGGLVAEGGDRHPIAKVLVLAPVLYIGRLSYSLYLWHWPVFVLFRWTVGLDTLPLQACALLCSVAAASFCHHVVEKPALLAWQRGSIPPGRTLLLGWAGVFLVAGASLAIVMARPWLNQTRAMKEAADWYPQTAVSAFVGSPNAPTLWVLGDSHARAMVTTLSEVQAQEGLRVKLIWDAGCAIAKPWPLMPAHCNAFLARAKARVLAGAQRGDLLLLPGLRTSRLGDQWAGIDIRQALAAEQSAEAAAARTRVQLEARAWLEELGRKGVRVIVELPKPLVAAPAFRCADWFNQGNPVCQAGGEIAKDVVQAHVAPTTAMLRAAARGLPHVSMWDTFGLLCPGTRCSSYAPDGRPLLFDGDHLTAHANRIIVPSLREALQKAQAGG